MVSGLVLLAHGADPTPLAWDEALANLVKFSVTFLVLGFMSYPILAPLFQSNEQTEEPESESPEQNPVFLNPENLNDNRNEIVGWIAAGLVFVLAVGWWLARTSLVEISMDETLSAEEHAHSQTEGGQIAMWGDFHAEVVRVESGELRIYLRDSYNRDIAARFFEAQIQVIEPAIKSSDPDDEKPEESDAIERQSNESEFIKTDSSLNDSYRFARLPLEATAYRVRVSTPGWSATLKFNFDGSQGRRSLPIWCANP